MQLSKSEAMEFLIAKAAVSVQVCVYTSMYV